MDERRSIPSSRTASSAAIELSQSRTEAVPVLCTRRVDPGYHTGRNLTTWGSSHAPLWRVLRRKGRRIRVVAVARDLTQ